MPSACNQRAICVQSACNQHAISVPKAFMDVATEPDSRLDEARGKHVPKEAAARAVAVVALIEHPSWRHLMKEAIMMKEAILRSDSMAGSAPDGSYMRYKHVAWR